MMLTPAPADHDDRHALIVAMLQTLSRATNDGPDNLLDPLADVLHILGTDDLQAVHDSASTLMAWVEEEWARRDDPGYCENCATPIEQTGFGRPRRFCSDACRQQAGRTRRNLS